MMSSSPLKLSGTMRLALISFLISLSSAAQSALPVGATTEVFATFRARLTKADPMQKGDLTLFVSADAANGEHAIIRIPLASTGEAYGEERTCRTNPAGNRELVYTAGLDEANYVEFAAATDYKEFHFLLNRYLCRLLAAPFHCKGQSVSLTAAWGTWRLGREMHVDLLSAASATVDTTPITTLVTTQPFDRERCASVAPSGGFCCVGGHTTEWHCGGTPSTAGWEQISGECFHRETPTACHDGEPLPSLPQVWR